MTDLNKERMELELSAGVLDRQIDNLKAEISEGCFDDNQLDGLVDLAIALGEVYAQRDLLEKAKVQAVPVWVSTDFMLPDEGVRVLFLDKYDIIHEGTLNTDYVDGPYGENGEDLGDNQTLWTSNSNGEELLLSKVKYWMHRPSSPSASESGAEG